MGGCHDLEVFVIISDDKILFVKILSGLSFVNNEMVKLYSPNYRTTRFSVPVSKDLWVTLVSMTTEFDDYN